METTLDNDSDNEEEEPFLEDDGNDDLLDDRVVVLNEDENDQENEALIDDEINNENTRHQHNKETELDKDQDNNNNIEEEEDDNDKTNDNEHDKTNEHDSNDDFVEDSVVATESNLWQRAQAGEQLSRIEALWLTLAKLKAQIEQGEEAQSVLRLRAQTLQTQLDQHHAVTASSWDLLWNDVQSVVVGGGVETKHCPKKKHTGKEETPPVGDSDEETALWKTVFKLKATMEHMEEERVALEHWIEQMQDQALTLPQRNHKEQDDTTPVKSAPIAETTMTTLEDEEEEDNKTQNQQTTSNYEDLDNMLDSLDIDGGDFDLVGNDDNDNANNNEDHNIDEETWNHRLTERPEVFSKRYRPSRSEQEELERLEQTWGIVSNDNNHNLFSSSFWGGGNPHEAIWKRIVEAPSLLLKRGSVALVDDNGKEMDADLVLLTQGLAVATRSGDNNAWALHCAVEYKSVAFVGPVSQEHMLQIQTQPPLPMTITILAPSTCQAWLDALEIAIIQFHLHHGTRLSTQNELGWQYKLIHKPGFTMAVTGIEDDLPIDNEKLNELDSYNGYAPLHYAVRWKHETIARHLLQQQPETDPNIPDRDGLTCVYHAVHDEAPDSLLSLLQEHGATGVQDALAHKADLVQRVEATRQLREERAQAEMAENMRLLQERGEKIEQAAERSRQLQENAAEYADLAKKLKETSRAQAEASPLWNPFASKQQQ